jgi:GNAT superfamily N-acetyltransferase
MTVATLQEGALPENYSIALSSKKNLKAIPAIELAAAATFAEADLPIEIRYRVTDQDVLEGAWRNGRLWIALDRNDHVVGFSMLEIVDGVAHLDELDVHPDHARKGIGSRLLRVAIDWAIQQGYPAMTLVTFRHLVWNAPFYERFGFTEIEQGVLAPELREILQDEASAGINTKHRIAMRLEIEQAKRSKN